MKILQLCLILGAVLACSAVPPLKDYGLSPAQSCTGDNAAKCKLPDCRCESFDTPGNLKREETPQFVFLTYDDAVRTDNYDYYSKALFGRKNPDGCNVSATAFVSHEYTVYPKVHDLYQNGVEIALHSITHHSDTSYWRDASVDLLKKEFGGERQLISKFARIPEEEFSGLRLPFLQLSGNNSFEMMKDLSLTYDCSWPTRTYVDPGLWPYTLDYSSSQDCPIGPCPRASIPGVWVVPMLDWKDEHNIPCAMVDQCVNIPKSTEGVLEWIKGNFHRNYDSTKAPFGFYIHASWFVNQPDHLEAYIGFIDYLQTLEDVYIVNISRGLEWIRNPVPLKSKDWPACPTVQKSDCRDQACRYVKDDGSEIYMHICNTGEECPPYYPSLDHPLGQ